MMNPRSKIKSYRLFILIGFSLFFCSILSAQAIVIDTISSVFKEFQRDSILELVINTNTKQLIKKKFKEDWQPVSLEFKTIDSISQSYNGKLRARGNIRKEICYYPPLKLKFNKEWLNDKGLDSIFNDLKLVIACRKGEYNNKLVLKEYLTYQLYAALTEYSFRTQLVSLKIVDSNQDQKTINTTGFLIENEDEMATRLNGKCIKSKIMSSKSVDPKQWAFLSLFEYMIGNTDWAMTNSHNVKYIYTRTHDKAFPVAYDFDYSGVVNAHYAVHRESINIEDITTRYFLGSCRIQDQFEQHIPLFLEKKETLYNIIDSFNSLPVNDRKVLVHYLDEFYEIISNPKLFKRSILDKCIDK